MKHIYINPQIVVETMDTTVVLADISNGGSNRIPGAPTGAESKNNLDFGDEEISQEDF